MQAVLGVPGRGRHHTRACPHALPKGPSPGHGQQGWGAPRPASPCARWGPAARPAAPGLRRAGGDVPVAGLAPVHSPLLPLDGAHLLLAELLPLLPRDLHSVILRHGRRRVARPAEEAQLRGAGGVSTGGCGQRLATAQPRWAAQAARRDRVWLHVLTAPRLPVPLRSPQNSPRCCKPSRICVPARHGLAQHCKPWHGHAPAAPQAPALPPRRCKPSSVHPRCCKPSRAHTPALQILAHLCTSTANPGTPTRQHCKPSHHATLTLQTLFHPPHCFKPSHNCMRTPQALIPPPGHTARLRTPVRGGAARPCAPVLAAAGPGSRPRVTAGPPEPACPPRRAAASGGPGNS